jgi:hypothetical protein
MGDFKQHEIMGFPGFQSGPRIILVTSDSSPQPSLAAVSAILIGASRYSERLFPHAERADDVSA